jgi:two-component system cell cycle sensor histidine kinase/response regulator CckA
MIPADHEQWRAREVARLLALVEAERRYYQDILASVPAGLAVVGADFSLLSANRAFRALFSLRDTPLVRVRFGDLFQGEEVRQAIAGAVRGVVSSTSLRAVAASGKRLRVSVQPLRGWSDEPEVLLLVEEAEGEGLPRLVESAPPVARWLEGLGGVVWERDAASLGLTAVFGACEALLGYTAAEWLAAPELHLERVHPEDRPRVEEAYRAAAAGGAPRALDYRALTADGRTVWLRDVVAAAGEGAHVKLRGLTIDITDLKELEQERAQAEKMAALGRLAAKVSQETSTLLAVLGGSGEQLRRLLPPDHPARREADEIASAIQRLGRIQRELQAFGRPPVLRPKVFEVNALVQNLAQQWRRQMGDAVELALSLDPEAGSVNADAEALSGILTMLVEQAKAAMSEGGRIDVATARIEREAGAAFASVTITDSGPDLDEEARNRLFEPFFSCGRFPQGLAGAYSLVRASGGELRVRRAPRGGTCFTILLPQVDVSAVVNSGPPAPAPSRRGGETVLVVEDEPGIRALMRKILQKQGYEVLEARNGEEALALAEERSAPIDLLLADVEMPEMSGFELATRLKALRPEMKILFVSGLPADELERFGPPPAQASFLRKPFSLAALLEKARNVLDGTDQPEG